MLFKGDSPIIAGGKNSFSQNALIGNIIPDDKYALILDPELDFERQLEIAKIWWARDYAKFKKSNLEDLQDFEIKLIKGKKNRKAVDRWKLYLRILDSTIDVKSRVCRTKEVMQIVSNDDDNCDVRTNKG
jgi:hypothetical protein